MKKFSALLVCLYGLASQNIFDLYRQYEPFQIGVENSLISERLSTSSYMGSQFYFSYDWLPWSMRVQYNANSFMSLFIENPVYTFSDSIPSELLNGLEVRPNRYELHYPIEVRSSYEYQNWSFHMTNALVFESFDKQNITGFKDEDEKTTIQYNSEKIDQYSIDNLFLITRSIQNSQFGIGIKNARFSLTSDSLQYQLNSSAYPFLTYAFNDEVRVMLSEIETGFSYIFKVTDKISFGTYFQYYNDEDERVHVNFNYRYKYSDYLNFYADVKMNLVSTTVLSLNDINRFLTITRPDLYNQKTKISVGVNYAFTDGRQIIKPSVQSFSIYEQDLFTYNPEKYAANPFATVKLQNTSDDVLYYKLLITSDNEYIFYETNLQQHLPNSELSIPVYAYFKKALDDSERLSEQITIKIVIDGYKEDLYRDFIKVNGRSYWDGNISGLKIYINQPDKFFDNKVKKILDKSYDTDLDKIKSITEKLGGEITYQVDPIISNSVDKVQDPFTTFSRKKGDCEDLVVYFSYLFSANGLENEILSIPAQPGKQGHVLLLVNTGLEPEQGETYGLNEFNSLIREDRFGAFRLWIPFETTVVDKGFDEILKTGGKLYHSLLSENKPNAYEIFQVTNR